MLSSDLIVEQIESLCPVCGEKAPSLILEHEGKVYQRSLCPEHADAETPIFSNSALYRRLDAWNALIFGNGNGASHAGDENGSANGPTLAVIDLTNRCNYRCPLCFAETNSQKEYYYLPLDSVRSMLASLLELSPAPCRHVQFSGGEPTLHPEFPQILRMAREMGFTHIQAATNGSRFVDPAYAALCEEAGLHTLYLQFDAMSDEVYLKLRGQRLLEKKIAAVENVARTNMRIVLVPTIMSSVNVDQIRPLFEFALEHSRHITGISIQPAADIGRVQLGDGAESPAPFNLADMALEFGKQTGLTRCPEDWFPLNAVSAITEAVGRVRGERLPRPACDAHCSVGTYFYVDERNKPVCITRFFDLDRFLRTLGKAANGNGHGGGVWQRISRMAQLQRLSSCFDKQAAPAGMTFERLLRGLEGWEDKSVGRAEGWTETGFNGIFVAGMHFMDSRNYNFRRLRRCIVQYVTTDRQVIPFCSYNGGARLRNAEELTRISDAVCAH
jgi:uncharacterized radical SAM superfamily Fe-S cluster-containing enzyme